MNPAAAAAATKLLDWRIIAVIFGFIILIVFVLKPKSDKKKAEDSENRAKIQATEKVRNAYNIDYGIKKLIQEKIKPSDYLKKISAPALTDSVTAVKNIKYSNIIPDPLNLTPSQRIRQQGINALYNFKTITAFSLFARTFFEQTGNKLEPIVRTQLNEEEAYELDKHLNSLKAV